MEGYVSRSSKPGGESKLPVSKELEIVLARRPKFGWLAVLLSDVKCSVLKPGGASLCFLC